MEPVGTLAPLISIVCALALAGVVLHQRGRIKRLRARIEDANRTDPLTGLLNRRAFEERLELELERAVRSDRPVSVIIGDIDSFRTVNEQHGHDAGDTVLQAVSVNMLKWKRRIDVAARVGGEEFALLLPETDERGAFIVAERLRRATHRCFLESPFGISFSFGIATAPGHATEAVDLMRAADRAMAAGKDLGGDHSVIYSDEVARKLRSLGSKVSGELKLATAIALADALDVRDMGSGQHSHTVGRYAEVMARELGFDEDRVERVRLAGVLHDIGKIGISDNVFTKPGPLDADEWREIYRHPEMGARLLGQPEFEDIRSWILAHHERPDGFGYPFALPGHRIPLEASIIAVADAYEAMTADRVYRPALGEEAARAELEAAAGSQFDPAVVAAFLRALDAGRARRLRSVA
ncbi:MAG TPA: diguanylate cyclase [Thermoleophilaceae bacterium]|jgi:diguanylate cyclase (GGDEF)-like protein/putative nucleotidyltransferase with HDIG domain|nr:diguanylate cyclase [Thermoleophilaceae bacterium]